MRYLSSKMPSKIFYASHGAAVLRINKTTTKPGKISASGAKIISRIMKKRGNKSRIIVFKTLSLKNTLTKFYKWHTLQIRPGPGTELQKKQILQFQKKLIQYQNLLYWLINSFLKNLMVLISSMTIAFSNIKLKIPK